MNQQQSEQSIGDTLKAILHGMGEKVDQAKEGFENFMGPAGMGFLRQGLAELRELGNPGLEGSVAQPTQLGVWGHPPSGIVTNEMTGKDQTFSMDQIKDIGKEVQEQAKEHGRDDQSRGRE